jgi:endonuclease III related protein
MDDKKLNLPRQHILTAVYQHLYQTYGPQHWWPAEKRFEMNIGAILTQSASWANAAKAIANLKTAGKLSPEALRETPEAELAQLVRPSGYFNVKARKIKAFVEWLGKNYNDNLYRLYKLNIDELRKELLSIYGVGEETADSIILYSAYKPIFVTDAYTRRLIDRLGLTPHPNKYSDYQKLFMSSLPHETQLFNEYHALIVRHAKEACRKNPACENCCLKPIFATNRQKKKSPFPCQVTANK